MQIPVRGAKQWPAFGDTGNKWLRERENGNKLRRNCESEADERNFVVNSARLESDDERACWIIVQGGRSNRYFGSWPFTLSLSCSISAYPSLYSSGRSYTRAEGARAYFVGARLLLFVFCFTQLITIQCRRPTAAKIILPRAPQAAATSAPVQN